MSLRSAARWWFTDRRTGRIAIVQAPNALSVTAAAAAVLGAALPGRAGRAARPVREVAALAWGFDEALRGVNPWRRAVGGTVVAVQAWRLLRR